MNIRDIELTAELGRLTEKEVKLLKQRIRMLERQLDALEKLIKKELPHDASA